MREISIDTLREIGWSLWDPIGLNNTMGGWKGQPFEDEYDTYLIKAAEMLQSLRDVEDVVDYLLRIETEHMGLGLQIDEARTRAKILKVAEAISKEARAWNNN